MVISASLLLHGPKVLFRQIYCRCIDFVEHMIYVQATTQT
jgi:hypothetical protein